MPTINISVPNDFDSWDCYEQAVIECYGSAEEELDAADSGRAFYDRLSSAARDAGLQFVRETDYGADWAGTDDQIARAKELLPPWGFTSGDDYRLADVMDVG